MESEPALQVLSKAKKEELKAIAKSSIVGDEARSDLRIRGLFRRGMNAYFDVRVVNPIAESHSDTPISKLIRDNEKAKIREYGRRVLEVEHASFHPLVFSTEGHMGIGAKQFLRTLASKLAEKRKESFSKVLNMLRVRLSFALRRSA